MVISSIGIVDVLDHRYRHPSHRECHRVSYSYPVRCAVGVPRCSDGVSGVDDVLPVISMYRHQ